ncbi:hypothetical protein E6C67_02025 [Azospirillum sp. TSA2s]|uniref:hypothetical protein n=1 Tax=Azospirillum sp. TSA2s TaxID=709810 RepID=UPI0010AA3AFE|nr:hypothetical protein [Azospirillum sp. TSA2s]QCG92715.1 hypothetical protein E6C67_02025 [Azospirillum sp. TSA2s]
MLDTAAQAIDASHTAAPMSWIRPSYWLGKVEDGLLPYLGLVGTVGGAIAGFVVSASDTVLADIPAGSFLKVHLSTIFMWSLGAIAIGQARSLLVEQRLSKANDKIGELERRLRSSNGEFNINQLIKDLFDYGLAALSKELGFNHTHRISVFLFNQDQFELISRYAADPQYNSKKTIYFPNKGVIARAWREGEAWIDSMSDPATNFSQYWKKQRDFSGISRTECSSLTMRSRAYGALRVNSPDGVTPLAVFLCESTSPQPLPRNQFEDYLRSPKAMQILDLLQRQRTMLGNKSAAASLED